MPQSKAVEIRYCITHRRTQDIDMYRILCINIMRLSQCFVDVVCAHMRTMLDHDCTCTVLRVCGVRMQLVNYSAPYTARVTAYYATFSTGARSQTNSVRVQSPGELCLLVEFCCMLLLIVSIDSESDLLDSSSIHSVGIIL